MNTSCKDEGTIADNDNIKVRIIELSHYKFYFVDLSRVRSMLTLPTQL